MEYREICEAAEYVRRLIDTKPTIGIILGSGLGDIAEEIENKIIIPYGEIPNFCCSTAIGHKGRFVVGTLNNTPVICMQGRLHYYEGYGMPEITLPIRVMKLLGIKALIITNAAGGINFSFERGDIMLIEDHINFMGYNPLIGRNIAELGPRFCDMTYTYTPSLQNIAKKAADRLSILLKSGVYLACTGPSFETPAEIRAFRSLGADAVGMSTVPEAIVASHCGLKVLAFSLITNMAAGVKEQPITEDEVIKIGAEKGKIIKKLIFEIVGDIKDI